MHSITNKVSKLSIRKDTLGQDLIEYALLGGFLAFGAGVLMPAATGSFGTVFSRVSSVLTSVAQGSDLGEPRTTSN